MRGRSNGIFTGITAGNKTKKQELKPEGQMADLIKESHALAERSAAQTTADAKKVSEERLIIEVADLKKEVDRLTTDVQEQEKNNFLGLHDLFQRTQRAELP